MILRFKSQRIILTLLICTLAATIIVGIFSVRYMQKRFNRYDDSVFEKIVESSKDIEPSLFFENIEGYINNRDIIFSVDSDGSVTWSEGLVIGEKFKDIVHKQLVIDDGWIRLSRKDLNLNTYVSNVNVKVDQVYTFVLSDGSLCYYIPFRLVGENDYLSIILISVTIACFITSFGIGIINKDISDVMKEEKISLNLANVSS